MLIRPNLVKPRAKSRNMFRPGWVHRGFQLKYTLGLMGLVAASIAIVVTPFWWFFSQNQEIFIKLAYDIKPQLVMHLEKEQSIGLFTLAFGSLISLGVACFLGMKMTGRFIAPLVLLQKHIYRISKGDLRQPELVTRSTDENHELIWHYNYLYRSLQGSAREELKALQKLDVDPNHREAWQLWLSLMNKKADQMGFPRVDAAKFENRDERRDQSRDQRRVA